MVWLDKVKIRYQLISVVTAAIIAISLINLVVSALISSIIMEKSIEYTDSTADKFVKEIEYTNEKALSIINFLQYSDMTQDYFKQEQYSNDAQLYMDMDLFLTSVRLIYPELEDIALIGKHYGRSIIKEQDLLGILDRHPSPKSLECDGIFEQVMSDLPSYKMLIYIRDFYSDDLKSNYAKPIGRCILGIRPTPNAETSSAKDTSYLIMDSAQNYYAINCTDDEAQKIKGYINPDNPTAQIDNRSILLKTWPVGGNELYIVSCTDKSLLFRDMRYVQILSVALCLVIIGILGISVLIISRNIVSPIYALKQYMRNIADGNYTHIKQKVSVSGNLEMVELADDLNALISEFENRTHRLFSTTERMYEIELEKQQAELSFLRSQINPHFLYNSLETLKGICMKNKFPEGAAIANNLGKIFRYSIKGENIVKFRDEISVIKAYVDIQSARFPHKVDVLYGISEKTLDIPIVKMILQPIVENVFQHAVETSVEKTTLYIASERIGDDLLITVQDDGVGISPERLEKLNLELAKEQVIHTDSIGLVNVNLRIRMLYGADYGITIESAVGDGTKVTLKMAAEIPHDDIPQRRETEAENEKGNTD